VQVDQGAHPTAAYVELLRGVLARQYPAPTFYVLPVDIVTQILNFGSPRPLTSRSSVRISMTTAPWPNA